MKITRGHHISFKHAFDGLIYAFLTQPNFRIHFYATFLAVFLGFYLNASYFEWVILVLTIFIVYVTELINTSIEATTDLLVTEHNPIAKVAKDTAAAAVLMVALGALVIGCFLFLPKILILLGV